MKKLPVLGHSINPHVGRWTCGLLKPRVNKHQPSKHQNVKQQSEGYDDAEFLEIAMKSNEVLQFMSNMMTEGSNNQDVDTICKGATGLGIEAEHCKNKIDGLKVSPALEPVKQKYLKALDDCCSASKYI